VIANNISAVSRHLEQLSFDVENDHEIGSDYFHLWLADAFPFFEQKIDEVLFSIAFGITLALQNGLGDSGMRLLNSESFHFLLVDVPSFHA